MKKYNKVLSLLLIITVITLCMGLVTASNNFTANTISSTNTTNISTITTDTITSSDSNINDTNQTLIQSNQTTQSSIILSSPVIDDVSLSTTNPTTTIRALDVHNDSTGNYSETGYLVSNATIKIYNSNHKLVYSGITDSTGIITTTNLNYGKYTAYADYSTYKQVVYNFTVDSYNTVVDVRFIPDICLLVYYGAHSEKVNILMNLSKRVYYINTFPTFESNKVWMLDYANYIQLDMYASSTYQFDTSILVNSPANQNYKVAYTFGVYNSTFLNSTGIHFLGANAKNNTPYTLANTYIGSYFQANDITDMDVLNANMVNLLGYIEYLLGDSKVNPTLDSTRTPLLASTLGIYHTRIGKITNAPSQKLVNQWINSNPGYNSDGQGSLNWMTNEYVNWTNINSNPLNLFKTFDKWYSTNYPNLTNPYVIIVSYYPGGNLIDAMIKTYEAQNRSVFNLYQSSTSPSVASVLTTIYNASSRGVSLVNSLYSWSMDYENMSTGGAISEYTSMNINVIRALNEVSQTSYLSQFGPQAEWTYAVTIPSFEGVYGAILCSYLNENGTEIVIQSGVDKLVESSLGWVNLKEKNNTDKKVAVVLYDYPPGKGEIGASYLDVFSSVHDLLVQLSRAGYDIRMSESDIPNVTTLYTIISEMGNKGIWAQGLLNQYVEKYYNNLTSNGQLIDYSKYLTYFNSLNKTLQDKLVEYWGSSIGNVMVYNSTYIVIPGMLFGNVFITFQPSRGWENVEDYHSSYLPPSQQYVSFYKWLKNDFKADAIINMGTHGTIEFLPGRSIGLQADDWTFELSGTPTIYPYIVSNPGEAMVAKERLAALVISHMTPAMVISELYGNLTTLDNYITNYQTAIKNNASELAEHYQVLILNLSSELAYTQPTANQTFDNWVQDLHEQLEDLSNDVVALGLHTLGVGLTGDNLTQEVITVITSRTTINNYILHMLYPNLAKYSYSEVLHNTNYTHEVDAVQAWLTEVVSYLVTGNATVESIASIWNITNTSEFYADLVLANTTIGNLVNNAEWAAILNALSGGYVQPGLMADPTYGDSLPTGKNIYTTDTTKMPSKAAYATAKDIVNKLLVNYYEQHGTFPELLGVIMWGTELLRTEGIMMGEFMYLLGVTPVWSATGAVTGIELIPLDELTVTLSNGTVLNRPRVDVYASMVTSNSNWISLLVQSTYLVFNSTPGENASVNMVKKHYAENPSLDRLFGLPGNVLEGTGMSDFIPQTNKWQNTTDVKGTLADIYLSRVSYAWTVENGKVVVTQKRSDYEYLLKNVDIITQNIDSSWRFLDSDDYYDWYGGMVGAAKYLGNKPDTSVVDIRNKNDIITRTLSQELEFEVRSVVLNPKVQASLLGDNPSGWQAYAKRYEYIFGFETVAGGSSNSGSGGGSSSGSGSGTGSSSGTGGSSLFSNSMYDALANNVIGISKLANADYKATSFQTSAAWMIYSSSKGYWKADSKTLTKLVDCYVQSVVQYGFACCHHTCANLEFNKMVMQMSSLDPTTKEKYNQLYQQMSGTSQNVYTSSQASSGSTTSGTSTTSGASSGSSSGSSSSSVSGSSGSDSSSSAGSSASVGDYSSHSSSDSSSSSGSSGSNGQSNSQSSSSGSSGSSGDQGSTYEVSSHSASSSAKGSMPVAVIASILVLLAIFGFGYAKARNHREDINDDDDY